MISHPGFRAPLIGLFVLGASLLSCNSSEKKYILSYYYADRDTIWELRYARPKYIFISVIDPRTSAHIKEIKEKKPFMLDYNISFLICRHNSNIVLIGLGTTPVFDVYNPVTYEKISGFEKIEQMYPGLKSNIHNINLRSTGSKYFKDTIVEITTRKWIRYYYHVEKDVFIGSEKELYAYINKAYREMASDRMRIFKLSEKKLYAAALSDLENPSLLTDEIFTDGSIMYSNNSIAVITSFIYHVFYREGMITGFDITGKKLFKIMQYDYPNFEKMKKNNIHPEDSINVWYAERPGRIILGFNDYGAIYIDIASGKSIWKYEPEVKP